GVRCGILRCVRSVACEHSRRSRPWQISSPSAPTLCEMCECVVLLLLFLCWAGSRQVWHEFVFHGAIRGARALCCAVVVPSGSPGDDAVVYCVSAPVRYPFCVMISLTECTFFDARCAVK
ncbi:hypothetical protein TraAM80_03112, partial [Trypanosoma rangeli]